MPSAALPERPLSKASFSSRVPPKQGATSPPAALKPDTGLRGTALRECGFLFYQQMFTIREVEQALLNLCGQGRISGTVHTCIGQEACAVGMVNALDRGRDVVCSNHRGHGHFLALHDDVEGLIAEIMGRASGICGGVGGSQHLHKGNFYTNGIQGGMVASALGMALAEKKKGAGAIATAFIGDGTLGQGIIYESMNIASKWELPLLLVLEDNGYAQSTPSHLQHAGRLADRALPFGIATTEMKAEDVFAVRSAASDIVAQVRRQGRPHFLVLHTYRLAPHSKGDDYRPAEEVEAWRQKDPLWRLRKELLPLDEARLADIEGQARLRVSQAVASAEQAPHWSLAALIEGKRSAANLSP